MSLDKFLNKKIFNLIRIFIFTLFIFSFGIAKADSSVELTSCQEIGAPGEYYWWSPLAGDVSGQDCLIIKSEGVILTGTQLSGNIVADSDEILSPDTDGYSFEITGDLTISGNISSIGNGAGGKGTVTYSGAGVNGATTNANVVFAGENSKNAGTINGDVVFLGYYSNNSDYSSNDSYIFTVDSSGILRRFVSSTMQEDEYTDLHPPFSFAANAKVEQFTYGSKNYLFVYDNSGLYTIDLDTMQSIADSTLYYIDIALGFDGSIYAIQNGAGTHKLNFETLAQEDYWGYSGMKIEYFNSSNDYVSSNEYLLVMENGGGLRKTALNGNSAGFYSNSYITDFVVDGQDVFVIDSLGYLSVLDINTMQANLIAGFSTTISELVINGDDVYFIDTSNYNVIKTNKTNTRDVVFDSQNMSASDIVISGGNLYVAGGPIEVIDPVGMSSKGTLSASSLYLASYTGKAKINGNVSFAGNQTFNAGEIVGNVEFNNSSTNRGLVTGNTDFLNSSSNDTDGTVNGDADFSVRSFNIGTINGTASFDSNSYNTDLNTSSGVINGDAVFYGIEYQHSPVLTSGGTDNVSGSISFTNPSVQFNLPSDFTEWTEDTSVWVFSGSPEWTFYGGVNSSILVGDVNFAGSGTANNGTITGDVVFSGGDSYNAGTINGNVRFTGTGSYNSDTTDTKVLYALSNGAILKIDPLDMSVDTSSWYSYTSTNYMTSGAGYLFAEIEDSVVIKVDPSNNFEQLNSIVFTPASIVKIVYDEGFLYVLTSDGYFRKVDIQTMTETESVLLGSYLTDMDVDTLDSGMAYISTTDDTLWVVDLSNFTASSYYGPYASHLDYSGGYVYYNHNGVVYKHEVTGAQIASNNFYNTHSDLEVYRLGGSSDYLFLLDGNYLNKIGLGIQSIQDYYAHYTGAANDMELLTLGSSDYAFIATVSGTRKVDLSNMDYVAQAAVNSDIIVSASVPAQINGTVIFTGQDSYNSGKITGTAIFHNVDNGGNTGGSVVGDAIRSDSMSNVGIIENDLPIDSTAFSVWLNLNDNDDATNADNWSNGVPYSGISEVVLYDSIHMPNKDEDNFFASSDFNIIIAKDGIAFNGEVDESGITIPHILAAGDSIGYTIDNIDFDITSIQSGGNLTINDDTLNIASTTITVTNDVVYLNYEGLVTNPNTFIYAASDLIVNGVSYGPWNGVYNPTIYYYNNATGDGDWNNLNNWWTSADFSGDHPGALPTLADQVIVSGSVLYNNGSSSAKSNNITFNGTSTNAIIIDVANAAVFMGSSTNSGVITASTSKFYGENTWASLNGVGTVLTNFLQRIYQSSAVSNHDFTSEGGSSDWVIEAIGNIIVNISNAVYDLSSNIFTALQGAVFVSGSNPAGQPTPTIVVSSPAASATIIKWKPVVDWGNADVCVVSYDNFSTTTTVTCANGGSDIPRPTSGSKTLSLRGTNVVGSNNNISETSVSFVYDNSVALGLDSTDCSVALNEATRPYFYLTSNTNCSFNFDVNAEFRGQGFANSGTISSDYNLTLNNFINIGTTTLNGSGDELVTVSSSTLENISGNFSSISVTSSSTIANLTAGVSSSTISILNSTAGNIVANGANNGSGNGGNGSSVTVSTSTTGTISVSGGNGTGNGGHGGTITINNSYSAAPLATLAASGGSSTSCGDGGDAGSVTLTNSTYGTITVNPGSGQNSGCPSSSKNDGASRTPSVTGNYTAPSSGENTETPSQDNQNTSSSGSSSSKPREFGKVVLPVRDLKPLDFAPLPKFGVDEEGSFSFIKPIQRFLNAPMPKEFNDKFAYNQTLSEYIKSIGINTAQALVNIQTKPITLLASANDVSGLWSAYTKGIPVRGSDGSFSQISKILVSSVLTGNKTNIIYQKIKVSPKINLTVSLKSDLNESKGTFNGKDVFFKKEGDRIVAEIVAPRAPGTYYVSTGATPIALAIEVIGDNQTQTNSQTQTPPTSIWGKVKSFFGW